MAIDVTCAQIGAEELDPESYRTSLELRAQLQEAARARSGLETALRNLQNQLRPEDAEALERALQVRAWRVAWHWDGVQSEPLGCRSRAGFGAVMHRVKAKSCAS